MTDVEKQNIRELSLKELTEFLTTHNEKAFRAKQIWQWIWQRGTTRFEEMTNLSKQLREKLNQEYEIREVSMIERQISEIDGTNKFLFELYDGNVVESVLMKYKHGNSGERNHSFYRAEWLW